MVAEKDRVVAFYPGIGAPGRPNPDFPEIRSGQMLAISYDPLLLNWKKSGPVNTDAGDSDIWKEGDTYFGLIQNVKKYYLGSPEHPEVPGFWGKFYGQGVWPNPTLWSSKDLITWEPRGELLYENTPYTDQYDEATCPTFLKVGDKHILLFFSEKNGGQYFLGDYDENIHKFRPYDHGRFNHGQVMPGGVGPPSGSEDGSGGVINILNVDEGRPSGEWNGLMSLPQRLTLGNDKRLRIEPVAVESLRDEHRQVNKTVLPANQEIVLKDIQGNTAEFDVEIDPLEARWVQMNVLRSPNAEEQTSITFYNYDPKQPFWNQTLGSADTPDVVVLDGSKSSTLKDVWLRPPERASLRRGDEALRLKVFVDRSVVEVFINGRQYLAMRVYPSRRDSVGVSLVAHGQDAVLKKLEGAIAAQCPHSE